jgi:uncharacterized damage-inducible protein DinB
MSTAALSSISEIEMLRHQARMAHHVVKLNAEGVSHEDSLIQPRPAGNCLNWVVGHLLAIYHHVLPLLGQAPVMPKHVLKRYDRGSPPIRNAAEAIEFSELLSAWDECSRRVDLGLAGLTAEALTAPAPASPSNEPNETVGSLLSTISWHQAYHCGQTGILRRAAGKEGAIR